MNFEPTISALCYTFINKHSEKHQPLLHFPNNQVVEFVSSQYRNMPDYLKLPLFILTAIFDFCSIIRRGKRFHQLPPTIRVNQIATWKMSPLRVCRDLIRFYESLTIFSYYQIINN
ncbi:hypothetical protein [Okeania sp.]|uniref:hypothetical protein n=1 Tax=Okeania sp. TaxID=3100323 RepID=UPI002B4B5882|nr:hypothetical protein [Okeania sp.]MEB3340310.1 hypothetical protein [Okeania sp.]